MVSSVWYVRSSDASDTCVALLAIHRRPVVHTHPLTTTSSRLFERADEVLKLKNRDYDNFEDELRKAGWKVWRINQSGETRVKFRDPGGATSSTTPKGGHLLYSSFLNVARAVVAEP